METVSTSPIGEDFLRWALNRGAPPLYGPYQLAGRTLRGERDSTNKFINLLHLPDLFCRFANTHGSQERVLSFVERWGLPNGKRTQPLEEVMDQARRMNSLVTGRLEQFLIGNLRADSGDRPALRMGASQAIKKAVDPVLEKVFSQMGRPRLSLDDDVLIGWGDLYLDLSLLDGMHLQIALALIRDEEIKRCRECNGAFIYQEPRPGVKGGLRQRREAEFCSWRHAKTFGERERRRKARRARQGR